MSRRHEAERLEQEARGKLERQRITDQAEAERARKELLELEALRWVHQNQTHVNPKVLIRVFRSSLNVSVCLIQSEQRCLQGLLTWYAVL